MEKACVEGQLNPKLFIFYCSDMSCAYCKEAILSRTSKERGRYVSKYFVASSCFSRTAEQESALISRANVSCPDQLVSDMLWGVLLYKT